MSLDKE